MRAPYVIEPKRITFDHYGHENIETCPEDEAQLFGLYWTGSDNGLPHHIADFDTRAEAEKFLSKITADPAAENRL